MKRRTRQIAFRLADGRRRDGMGHSVAPTVKSSFKALCWHKGISASFRLEQMMADECGKMLKGFERPQYRAPKKGWPHDEPIRRVR